MPPREVRRLPVREIAARDARLSLWWPDPHIEQMPPVMTAFGFKFSGKAFTWIKTLRRFERNPGLLSTADIETALHIGLGHTTRKNSEVVWLGKRGSPKILSHSVHEVIVAPRREHSRKPDEFYRRVEAFCPGPRIDLFARESREGWQCWGDEARKFDIGQLLEVSQRRLSAIPTSPARSVPCLAWPISPAQSPPGRFVAAASSSIPRVATTSKGFSRASAGNISVLMRGQIGPAFELRLASCKYYEAARR
jgi:N6-adenosine-specific RNA methylase IME4